jgi:hypothetical protein
VSLDGSAYDLAEEVRAGKWRHVAHIAQGLPATSCREILAELRRRCPGYTEEQYRAAISEALMASR